MGSNINHIYQKTFSDLTSKESKGIDDVIFNNAKQLRKDAILIASTNKSYSSATSLLILSSEEIIKAILVLLHSEGYKVYKINDARKFFFDHKIRHQLAQLIEMTAGFIESLDKYKNQEPTKLINTKSEGWNSFLNGIFDLAKVIAPITKSTERIKDLENFNDNKNNGLYVGYKDKLIVPQDKVTETDYRKTKEIVDRIFRVYKIVRILYHPCIKNRKDQDVIEETKTKMKIFIDEGMEGFSFKELIFK
jgi:AbiV family abortive infection protein